MAISPPSQMAFPNVISSHRVATPFFYFLHIIHPDDAILEVQVIGPNLRYTFKHSRLKHLMSRSRRAIWLEKKTVGFLALVRGPDHHVSVWAESGHGSGRYGDVLDAPEGGSHAPEGVLPNTVWTRRVVQLGTMLGVNMPSFYDAMWGRTAGQDFGGFFHGSHAEAKLAVYGICSLLEGFGIASDLDNIRPRHLRKLRKVSWADGARPALEIYLSRKPCGRCGSLIRALSTITKIRIKLNFTDTLTKKVHGVSPVDLARGQQRTVLPITIARGVAADGRQDDAVGTTEDNEDDNSWDMMDLDDTDSMIEVEETVCDGLQDDAIATIEPYDADSDMYSSSDDTESDTDIDAGPGDSNQDGATVVISGGDHSNMTPSDDADSGIDIEEEAVGDRLQDEVVVIINNEGDNLAVRSIDDADGTEGAAVESCQDDVEVIIIDGGDDSDTTSADDADSWVDIETLAEEGCENGATAVATGDDNDLDMTFVDDADSGIEMGVAPDDSGQGDAIIISRDGLGTTSSDSTDSGVEIEGAVGESGEDDTVTAAGDDGDDSAMTPSDGAELVVESEVVREPIGQEDTVTITDHDGDDVDNPDVSCSDDASSAMVVEPDSGTDLVDLRTPQPTINRALKFLKTMSAYINKVEAAKLNLRRPEWLIRSSMTGSDQGQDQSPSAASTTSTGTRVEMTPRIRSLVPRRVRPRARRRAQNRTRNRA